MIDMIARFLDEHAPLLVSVGIGMWMGGITAILFGIRVDLNKIQRYLSHESPKLENIQRHIDRLEKLR